MNLRTTEKLKAWYDCFNSDKPTHTNTSTHTNEHKGSLCQSFADTSHDFCDVKLIKEKPRDWAGTAVYALCYATECEKHFLKPCQVKSTVRPADFSPWQLWKTGAKNQT